MFLAGDGAGRRVRRLGAARDRPCPARLGRRHPVGRGRRSQPGSRRGRGRPDRDDCRGGDRTRHPGAGLDLQRRPARAAHPGQGRRSGHRPLRQPARRADHHPLARRARAVRDGRRTRPLTARGEEGRALHLRLRRPRRVALLVPPARAVGGPGRQRTLRRAAGRGSSRRRRRRRSAHAGAERHRHRQGRRARTGRQRRFGRHGLRPRRRVGAGQRPDASDDARPRRRAAALAHRQRRQEPLLLPGSRRPALHRHRPGRRAAGAAGHLGHPAHHARRTPRRRRRPQRRARRVDHAAVDALQPRLRQRRVPAASRIS